MDLKRRKSLLTDFKQISHRSMFEEPSSKLSLLELETVMIQEKIQNTGVLCIPFIRNKRLKKKDNNNCFFSSNWWQVSRDYRDASFASTILLHSLDAARSSYFTLFSQMHFINKDSKKLKGAI